MQPPRSSYECYVLDTQILFPHVFLGGIPSLREPNTLYQNCVNSLFKRKLPLIVLPSIDSEFNKLILEKFRKLLQDIKGVAVRSRNTGEQSFYRKTASLIHSKNYPNDFATYWNANKPYFAKWLNVDDNSIERSVYRLIREALKEYQRVISHAEVIMEEWTDPKHEQECRELSDRLKRLRDVEKVIPCEAHEQDFDIISDCMVYRNHFLENGVLYLITDDNNCYRAAKTMTGEAGGNKSIVHNQRFDCIKPRTFLDRLKTHKDEKLIE